MIKFKISELAAKISAEVIGDCDVEITGINNITNASQGQITFVDNEKYISSLGQSAAAAVIVKEQVVDTDKVQLVVSDVNAALIKVLNLFAPKLKPVQPGVHSSAVIDDSADIADSVSVGANTCIVADVKIGENCIIASNVSIGQGVIIGDNTKIDANVVIYHNCSIGKNCLIQAGVIIGSLGFGYSLIDNEHKLVPHIGGVVIEDSVHLGANVCVDRAKFGNTIVGAGTKTDNLVQIAHNVVIGKCCLIVSGTAVGGSCKLGNGVVLAGQVGMADHIEIGADAKVGAQAGVITNIAPGQEVVGSPAVNAKDKFRQILLTQRLPEMSKQLKELTKKVKQLEATKNN